MLATISSADCRVASGPAIFWTEQPACSVQLNAMTENFLAYLHNDLSKDITRGEQAFQSAVLARRKAMHRSSMMPSLRRSDSGFAPMAPDIPAEDTIR